MKQDETMEDFGQVNVDLVSKWIEIDEYMLTPYVMQVLRHLQDTSETGLGKRFGELLDKLLNVVAKDESFTKAELNTMMEGIRELEVLICRQPV